MLFVQFEVWYVEHSELEHRFGSHSSNLLANEEHRLSAASSLVSTLLRRLDVGHVDTNEGVLENSF